MDVTTGPHAHRMAMIDIIFVLVISNAAMLLAVVVCQMKQTDDSGHIVDVQQTLSGVPFWIADELVGLKGEA